MVGNIRTHSVATKLAISKKLTKQKYQYTSIFNLECKHCNSRFVDRKRIKYCNNCSMLYKSGNRNKYTFTFNVYHYPDLFDLDQLTTIGWNSFGGRAGNYNPNGLTRDHKISVNEAIKNNYPPYYIKHPLNCEIMSFIDNDRKKSNSSISYDELKELVDNYDKSGSSNRSRTYKSSRTQD